MLIINMELNDMDKVKFSIGGDTNMPVYEAVDIHPQRWNGWLRPIVTIQTALQISEDIFNHNDLSDNESYHDIQEAIREARENLEDAVEVGGLIIWDEVE